MYTHRRQYRGTQPLKGIVVQILHNGPKELYNSLERSYISYKLRNTLIKLSKDASNALKNQSRPKYNSIETHIDIFSGTINYVFIDLLRWTIFVKFDYR